MTESHPVLQLVTRPDVDADVLLDLNADDPDPWQVDVSANDFSLGSPSFEGEPGATGVDHGPRTLTIPLTAATSGPVAKAGLAQLARLLLRPTVWLRFAHAPADEPKWFQLYTSELPALEWADVYQDDDDTGSFWRLTLTVQAAPWAVGPRETIPVFALPNNPTSAGCFKVLPDIKGDARTPLVVNLDPDRAWDSGRLLLSTVALENLQGTLYTALYSVAASGGTAGTNTTAPADATAIGGTSSVTTFTTDATMVLRRSSIPVTPPLPGLYRLLVRAKSTGSSTAFGIRAAVSPLAGATLSEGRDVDYIAATTNWYWFDLGLFSIPGGLRNVVDDDTVTTDALVSLYAERTGGAGSLSLDHLVLVPVDVQGTRSTITTLIDWPSFTAPSGTRSADVDAERDLIRVRNAAGALVGWRETSPLGGWPHAVPGCANLVHLFPSMLGPSTSVADALTATTDVTITYRPRYLNLAPVGS